MLYFAGPVTEYLRMLDPSTPITIPNRSLFKGSEVCELVKVQPYVLRSWESEFPMLGVSKSAGASRVYQIGRASCRERV